MKVLLLLITCFTSPPDSAFQIRFDQVHESTLKKYIKANEVFGLDRKKTILIVRLTESFNDDSAKHEWSISASGRVESLRNEMPAYISEIEGYAVAFYIGNMKTYVQYPQSYINDVNKHLVSRLEKTSPKRRGVKMRYINGHPPKSIPVEFDDRPHEKFTNWRVLFKKNEPPTISRWL